MYNLLLSFFVVSARSVLLDLSCCRRMSWCFAALQSASGGAQGLGFRYGASQNYLCEQRPLDLALLMADSAEVARFA